MKKIIQLSIGLFFIFVFLQSCDNKKTQISMKPETTSISGDLSDCFEVVNQEYIVKLKDGRLEPFATWSVKIRRTEKQLPFPEGITVDSYGTFGSGVQAHGGFGIEVVDENGSTIQKTAASASGLSGPYSSDDVKELFKLKPGEESTIRWTVDDNALDAKELKFTISSAYELCETSEVSTSSLGNANVDALLNQLESMLNKFQKMDEWSDEYDEMEDKIIDLMDKIEDLDMTDAQEKRYDRLDDKFDKH